VFLRDGDEVYRTYFIDARGDEALGSTWSFLDSDQPAAVVARRPAGEARIALHPVRRNAPYGLRRVGRSFVPAGPLIARNFGDA